MADYIERGALLDRLHKRLKNPSIITWVFRIIAEIPSADVAPVVHGRWEPHYEIVDNDVRISGTKRVCSVCKDIWESSRILPHCPSCGAKMDGGGT